MLLVPVLRGRGQITAEEFPAANLAVTLLLRSGDGSPALADT